MATYQHLLDIPGGVTLLTPFEVSKLLARISDVKADDYIDMERALERFRSVFEGAQQARNTVRRLSDRKTEVNAWDRLLWHPSTINNFAKLMGRSLRDPDRTTLAQVADVFRGAEVKEDQHDLDANDEQMEIDAEAQIRLRYRPDLLAHNFFLDIIARVCSTLSETSLKGGNKEEEEWAGEGDPDLKLPAKPLSLEDFLAVEKEHEAPYLTLADARGYFYAIWTEIESPKRQNKALYPDAFSWSARILLEAKTATYDLVTAFRDGRHVNDDLVIPKAEEEKQFRGKRSKPTGWYRVQKALMVAQEKGALGTVLINQALWEYCKIQRCAKACTDITGQTRIVDGQQGASDSSDQHADAALMEVYEAMRWNVVQQEMTALRREREAQAATRGRGLFGSSLSNSGNRAGFLSSLFKSEPETPNESQKTFKSTLLGTDVPRLAIPTDATYGVLARHFALNRGDYDQTVGILEDYRQSGGDGAAAIRPLNIAFYDPLFRGFALHGVPSSIVNNKDPEQDQWQLDPSVDSTSSVARWNMTNLLLHLEALLQMPSPSFRALLAQEWKYARILSQVSSTKSDPDRDQALEALLSPLRFMPSLQDGPFSAAAFEESSSPRSAASRSRDYDRRRAALRGRAPTPHQVFYILTALRRCMGDRHSDKVLEWYHKLKEKFSDPNQLSTEEDVEAVVGQGEGHQWATVEEEEEATIRRQETGWRGWKMDNRLKRLIPFLEAKAKEEALQWQYEQASGEGQEVGMDQQWQGDAEQSQREGEEREDVLERKEEQIVERQD